MFCHKCGAEASASQSFCTRCGAKLLDIGQEGDSGGAAYPIGDGPMPQGTRPQAQPAPAPAPQPAPPKPHAGIATLSAETKGIVIAVAAAVMVVALVCVIVVSSSRNTLYRTAQACGTETSDYDEYVREDQTPYSLDDGVMLLSGDHQSLAVMSDAIPDCVFDRLHMPDSIRTRFNETSSDDGMLSDSFDRFDVSWYYDGSRLYTVLTRKGLL
ncbi:zinc ribbon domain-containing protein [Bifidobacterium saguinibicoloris]|uniref:zinc ribbon domain-containing protein n=1 Tax=Bifidobacterium saguinibicoloris TaxID=2834433 RepID=UPI001C59052C|nr:zinc ribbon domain-containing protein [Bifidobacterium saguinibicoloris]MBW3079992.1 zinc ribbon domain-containing protein [Bifidobacterium saguinibicoloris]